VPTAKTTLNPAHIRPEKRALHKEPRLDDTIRPLPSHLRGLGQGPGSVQDQPAPPHPGTTHL